jgi:hypothetical protein
LINGQHGGLFLGCQGRWANDRNCGDGDRGRLTLNEVTAGVGDGEDPDGRYQRMGLAPVEGADGWPDVAVSFFPEAATEHCKPAGEPGVRGERGLGVGVWVIEEDAYLIAGTAVIQAVEREVSPCELGLVCACRQLDVEGDSHAGHPPITVLEEKDA